MKQLKKALAVAAAFSALALYGGQKAAATETELAWGGGTVIADLLNVRSGPNTDFEVLGRAPENSVLVILENTGERWYKVNYEGLVGYVDASYLGNVEMAKNFEAEGTITGDAVRLRASHDTESEVLHKYNTGDKLQVVGINEGWFKVTDGDLTGYIRSDFMNITGGAGDEGENADGETETNADNEAESVGGADATGIATTVAIDAAAVSNTADSTDTVCTGKDIVDFALNYVGYKYVYGEESPEKGFDCSGFTWYIYSQFGYSMSRTASTQYKNNGVKVDRDELQAGDIVCFSSKGSKVTHVGIYIGDDQFVHAENSRTGVVISDLSSGYYNRTWWGAKRIID